MRKREISIEIEGESEKAGASPTEARMRRPANAKRAVSRKAETAERRES